MQTTTKATSVSLTAAMQTYIFEKITEPVSRVLGSTDTSASRCDIEVGRTTRHHRKGEIWRAEVSLFLGKNALRAEAHGKSFGEAVDILKSEITREIKKFKGKGTATERKGARRAKNNATIANAARLSQ